MNGDSNAVDWENIFRALEVWRTETLRHGNTFPADSIDTAVTGIAHQYSRDPWAVLVSTILSLRTKDEVTRVSSRQVLDTCPTPAKLLKLPVEEIARLAYPAGFYRTKAANLKNIAAILMEQYDGQVPPDMDTLLALPGVGRKTANLVLSEAFDIDAICVDIHVHRISNRAGWLGPEGTRGPEQTEMTLREILPKRYWKRINSLLVFYGQRVCRPVSPYCSRCVIGGHCRRRGVERTR
ncbi:endonuclease III [Spirochaetia bacterium]|nr:endonuclease III [Spirochaetia bacterium]